MVYLTDRVRAKLKARSLTSLKLARSGKFLMIARSPKTSLKNLARLVPAAAMCLWALPAHAANVLTNGTFDTAKDPWWGNASSSEENPADYVLSVADGRLCVDMMASGKNPWDVIVGYSGVPLSANKYYRIAFTASANVERTIKFKTGLGDAPYSDYFLQTVSVGPTPKDFSVTYLNLREDPNAQFQYQVGTPSRGTSAMGQVCFDNIVIEEVAAPVLPAYVTPSMTGQPLKSRPAVVKMGTAVDTPIFLSSPEHNQIVANEFSMITPANSMKMNLIQPTQGVFDWVDTDALVAWAATNGLEFRGHPLVWHTQAPSWLTGTEFSRDEMIGFMNAHIDALMGRYKGQFPYWDVVNEAFDDAGKDFRPTFWHDRIGNDFIDLAFARARAADPSAKLFYNDYNIEQAGTAKGDKVFQMVSEWRARGVPIDGIGLQSHYFVNPDGTLDGVPNMDAIRANMARYNDIGVEVHITECDFRLGKPLDDAKLAQHTKFYSELLQICIDAPNCSHFTVWGLSDRDSWVPSTFPEFDYAHLYDADFHPRPAYQAMTQIFAKYNPDGTPVGSGAAASSDSSGCSMALAGAPSSTSVTFALFGLLGLSIGFRRASKRRNA